jgi:lipopolysaccharide transport system permease protein
MATLILALAKRDLSAQYRESVFGVVWAILKPTLFMLVFSVVKGIIRLPSEGVPYPLFSYTGISLWLLFVSILNGTTPSITRNAGIIRKMPTPRIVYPISGLTISLSEYVFALIPLIGLMIYFGWQTSWTLLYIIPIGLITALMTFAIALPLATLSVFKNDLIMALPYVLQAGLFMTPILYPLSSVPEQYKALYSLNPMVGPLEGVRSAVLFGREPDWLLFIPAFAIIVFVLPLSLFIYHRVSRYFADFF